MPEDESSLSEIIDRWFDDVNALERRQAVQTAPSDEPLSWPDRRTRLVRLDVAILAFHVFALRVGVRSVPGLLRQRISAIVNKFGAFLAEKIGIKLLGEFVGKVLAPIRLILTLWQSNKASLEYENAVRRAGIQTARELYLLKLSQSQKKRRTERVLTRHFIPRQRRPNGHARKRRSSHT